MALDFPATPTNGQVYGSYTYNSAVGAWQAREDSRTVAILSSTVPASANPGDIWVNTNDGISFVYYNDGTSAQWMEMLPSGVPLLNTKANVAGDTFTGNVTAPRFISNIATGTAPLGVTSTTLVSNLNADLLDGQHGAYYAPVASPTFTGTVSGITKSMVGLGSVDNTTDAGKPVSTATQTALDLKANLSGASFTGAINGSYGGTGTRFYAANTTAGTTEYTNAINIGNDTGNKVIHFLNSSTRTADGGANTYTIRNDYGMLNLGHSSYNTNIYGKVTMPQQPVYSGSLQYTPPVNAYPITYDTFIVGFSKSGNNRLTAQVAGKYYVAAQQLINGGSYLCIYKNGSEIAHAYSNADDTYDMNVSALIDLQVNDYVELYYHGGSLSYAWGDAHSRYSVFKVS